MFGFMGQDTVKVPSNQITGDDIVKLVEDISKTGQQAYANYLAATIVSKKAKNEPVEVPRKMAIERGWTTAEKVGVGVGVGAVLVVGAIVLWLMLGKSKSKGGGNGGGNGGGSAFPAMPKMLSAGPVIDVVPVKFLPGE